MSRSRNVKPGTFTNETLAECEPRARLLFIALWCEADREGRLEDRPKRIKARCLPYDDCNIDELLEQLATRGFIDRYTISDAAFISIPQFAKHQNPHFREKASTIPPKESPGHDSGKPKESPGPVPEKARTSPADSGFLIPDSLNPIPAAKALEQQAARSSAPRADRFLEFWSIYPVKKGRADALQTWKAKKLDAEADKIIADVRLRSAQDRQWLDGFAPHGSTYVRARGWEDEIDRRAPAGPHPGRLSAVDQVQTAIDARQAGAAFRPRANENFSGKGYVGTPIARMAPEMRAAMERMGLSDTGPDECTPGATHAS